jgi:hypothetical protein
LVIGQANSSKNKIIYSAPNGSGYLINFIIDGGLGTKFENPPNLCYNIYRKINGGIFK